MKLDCSPTTGERLTARGPARRSAVGLFCVLALASSAASRAQKPTVEIIDKTPQFLHFYRTAVADKADPNTRWKLWKQLYGVAAVPPGPEGDEMARKMLDDAWNKYPAALPEIALGPRAIHPEPSFAFNEVAQLLQPSVPVHVRLVVFVGAFEGNAYTFAAPEGPTVAVEVEDPDVGLRMTHEFTHVVQAEQSGLSLDWKRSLAHTIFAEGLAMQAVHRLHPELTDAQCVGEVTPGWFDRAKALRHQIIADTLPSLDASDNDTTLRFTMGRGPAGIEREAYFAGWIVIGQLLQQGWTFPRLARVKEAELVGLVRTTLLELNNHRSALALGRAIDRAQPQKSVLVPSERPAT